MRTIALLIALGMMSSAQPVPAQLVPSLPLPAQPLPAQPLSTLPRLDAPLAPLGPLVEEVGALPDRATRLLTDARQTRIADLVRRYPDQIALDPDGFPARAHEVVVSDPADALIAAALSKGFRLIERETVLGAGYARLRAPDDMTLKAAIAAVRRLGAREVAADQLHFQNAAMMTPAAPQAAPAPQRRSGPSVGMIDGGVAAAADGAIAQRGFAIGAPRPSDHGTAIASLIAGRGPIRGGAPGARVIAADVYGADPAGGSATAIARALGWLAEQGVPVVTISLVGPENPLLARVVAAVQKRGMILVAAVGNDGPAAPFAYPASYPGVIAVTAVDGRNRILIEAGRAAHVDYAAPGADMLAANASGGVSAVRGTSFAAPLAAARIARLYSAANPSARAAVLAQVDAEAQRLGKRYGRGLLCGSCRTPVK